MTTKEKTTYLLNDKKVLINKLMEDPEVILCYTGKIEQIICEKEYWRIRFKFKDSRVVYYDYKYISPAFIGIIFSLQAINGEIGEVKIETNYKDGNAAVNVYHEGELINCKDLPNPILKKIRSHIPGRRIKYIEDLVQELNSKLIHNQ